ncbi:hypothetical protein Aab01nite_32360 [Paractinoplanes abujensis]|uniref:Uncharacterized protein n=1 Tax=Paractinoplanes abujensis TaxID=882441 RepID=A0A7W7G6X9_9ACTN|nr:hypothetical protein [Actinoplanes abujensis]MBB4697870.1 hypothetical protein [Actinoplanes abujensis]GID19646.1 hypothetical protein Aab01nite_32360 [Actinoplanes abujensis]
MADSTDTQVEARVQAHLGSGETLRAAVWVSRADGGTAAGTTRSELNPFRFRRPVPDRPGDRRGVHGVPGSLAVGLDQHIRIVTDPRVLALTDQRLLVLAEQKVWFRPATRLQVRWQCPRTDLKSATGQGNGRLRLDFTDGSAVTLLSPVTSLRSFLEAL